MILNPYHTWFPSSFYSMNLSPILRNLFSSMLFLLFCKLLFFSLLRIVFPNLLGKPALPIVSTVNHCSSGDKSLICTCSPDIHPGSRGFLEVFKCPRHVKHNISKLELFSLQICISPEFALHPLTYVKPETVRHLKLSPFLYSPCIISQ